jgi:hypothetical protein
MQLTTAHTATKVLAPLPTKTPIVCMGNICRSPSAEAVLRELA